MALEEECDCEEGGSDAAWMATFADLMSLLLTFFVLLLSFANMDVVRFRVVLGSVRDAFGVQFEHPGDVEAVSTSIIQLSKQESSPNLQVVEEIMMLQKVKKFIKDSGMEGLMEASLDERGVVIRIKGHILFSSGEAKLKKEAPKALAPVVKLTKAMPHQLSIQGHTDNRPIKTRKFPSNWELSTSRAVATMRYLVSQGLETKRVNVAGYADMRPIADNDTAEGRARNRRVEFVFLRSPDKDPITSDEIELARQEIERLRAEKALDDDAKSVENLQYNDAGVPIIFDATPPVDAGIPMDATPPPDAEPPDARPIVAPDISPKFDPTKVTQPSEPAKAADSVEVVEE